jgi:hypothetical protein
MAEPQTTVQKVAWGELFPWLALFRSVRIALMPRVLVLAAIGLIVTTLGWRVIGGLFGSGDPVVNEWKSQTSTWLWNDSGFAIDLSARSTQEVFASARQDLAEAPADAFLFLTSPFVNLFDADLTFKGFICMLFACVWELAVWGIIGGAIARIAALKYTRDEAPGFVAALRHGLSKLPAYSLAPLAAVAGALTFTVMLFCLGLVMNADVLAIPVALIWPLVLLVGLQMAILLIGALVGWPLMWATVAVEGTDAFDALSRSYAYTYQRPWRLLWYVAFSVFLAAVSMFAVKAFAISAVRLGDWGISWGLARDERGPLLGPAEESATAPASTSAPPFQPEATAPPDTPPVLAPPLQTGTTDLPPPSQSLPSIEERWTIRTARGTIVFWQSLWKSLAAGYQAAFVWVSGVGIYLLLRRDIDGAEMDEVFVDDVEEHGIPALEEDASTGVPEVAPGRPAQPGNAGATGGTAAQG